MSGSFKATWLGDGDPNAQIIHYGDLRFVRGEAEVVSEKHDLASRIKGNPAFAIDDAKAEPVEADETEAQSYQEQAERGTEKGALKAQLRNLGITVQGNPSEDTLRKKLHEATKA